MDLEASGSGIRAAADEAATIGERLRAADVSAPLDQAAAGVPGSETARALGLLALSLREEVARIAGGWETWGQSADGAARAYDVADRQASARFGPIPR